MSTEYQNSIFQEARLCLLSAENEVDKDGDMDLESLRTNCERSRHLLCKLRVLEKDDLFALGLEQLSEMLEKHCNILDKKVTAKKSDAASLSSAYLSSSSSLLRNLSTSGERPHTPTSSRSNAPGGINSLNGNLDTTSLSSLSAAKLMRLHGNHITRCPTPPSPAGCSTPSEERQSKQRRWTIEATVRKCGRGGVGFADVVGLQQVKAVLQQALIYPIVHPQLFTGLRKPWQTILLYGPPGTGKSRLAAAIASEIDSIFYNVSSSDLISYLAGESEKLVRDLFRHAASRTTATNVAATTAAASATTNKHSVIFIDEVDAISRKRTGREEEHTRRVKNELLRKMDAIDANVFLLCATNCPWDIDEAFLRRFQRRIYIPLPDRQARLGILQLHAGKHGIDLSESEWSALLDSTDGYSGSDLANVCLTALYEPLKDIDNASFWWQQHNGELVPCNAGRPGAIQGRRKDFNPEKIQVRPVEFSDFQLALNTTPATVDKAAVMRFEAFNKKHEQQGV